jgi:hypothetical protein
MYYDEESGSVSFIAGVMVGAIIGARQCRRSLGRH